MSTSDRDGRTQLHQAARDNNVALAQSLLANGADPNARDRDGFTALHIAAQEYALEVARLLLDAGAEVDPKNKYGNTPLFTAVFNSRGRGEMIGLLRSRGADPRSPNGAGNSPVDLARRIANFDVRQFFDDLS